MIERVDPGAPEVIRDVFGAAYHWACATLSGRGRILDVGGGTERLGKHLLYGDVTDVDADPACGCDYTASVTDLPFADGAFDFVTCFETVEHVATPLAAVAELVRVASRVVLLSSVNASGPTWLPGGIPIWKGADNPYHLAEMDTAGFARLLDGLPVQFFSLMPTEYPDCGEFVIIRGLHPGGIVNYARIHADRARS
ncbi:class I SAM-dependent methyltransferase [Actinomadura violacea]|uniref:Class I SAM-dependent methyltransferase n=1 Tax=Actinomadura violacea TaxID=2819934 RepID=A0ABS3RXW2_9ACTN|nr:class I SAM-dependent methyltransferase [Actinomadura violacea]MBO2461593.1 class I SAM-dependent methyltransferase [Actinomadura violacea]